MDQSTSIVRHNNTRILYSTGWSLTPGPSGAEHTTSTVGETFGLKFKVLEGGSVEVFGGLRPTSKNSALVQSQYSLDGGPPFVYNAPWHKVSSTVVQMFNQTELSAGPHQLFARITRTADDIPYYLDYIRINGTVEDDPQPSPTPSTTPRQQKSPPIAAIVGGITGGLVLIAIIAIILFLLRRRKLQKRRFSKAIITSMVAVEHDTVTPFFDRRSTLPAPSKAVYPNGSLSTSAIVDADGAIRLGTGQILRPQDIPPAY
ncbi:hypothetical protein C8J57DRAFT_755368 [Mycena rebaudengoi]|nr:hypothetical protein C8J57DRAFT_755368 [Mycena rebaudengoi]